MAVGVLGAVALARRKDDLAALGIKLKQRGEDVKDALMAKIDAAKENLSYPLTGG